MTSKRKSKIRMTSKSTYERLLQKARKISWLRMHQILHVAVSTSTLHWPTWFDAHIHLKRRQIGRIAGGGPHRYAGRSAQASCPVALRSEGFCESKQSSVELARHEWHGEVAVRELWGHGTCHLLRGRWVSVQTIAQYHWEGFPLFNRKSTSGNMSNYEDGGGMVMNRKGGWDFLVFGWTVRLSRIQSRLRPPRLSWWGEIGIRFIGELHKYILEIKSHVSFSFLLKIYFHLCNNTSDSHPEALTTTSFAQECHNLFKGMPTFPLKRLQEKIFVTGAAEVSTLSARQRHVLQGWLIWLMNLRMMWTLQQPLTALH